VICHAETEQDQRARDPELEKEWEAAEAAEDAWAVQAPARVEIAYARAAGRRFRIK